MLEQLKIYFIEECNTSTLDFKYKSYPDLSGMTNDQLWFHANEYGYKEQRQIFHDCYYNSLFYDYYLADYRKIVLYHNPYFDWKIYKPTSEYDALIHYINKCDLSYNDVLTDVSYTNPHYSIVAECPSYDYQKFTFAYGAGQWSSGFFGLIVPCKSILKRVYFMYLYDSVEEYQVSEISDKYVFNSSSVRIKLDLYINGSMSDYYVEETLDASKNMLGALFKKKNINGPTISVDYDEIILEENSVISWFCSDLLSQTTNHEFINNPYNPARNRFIMILEPYNTRYVSNPNIDLGTINSDIKMNQYNISLKQNKLNSGNNIQIVDNIISVVGLSGVESNFYYVNQLRNDVESSFVEINDLITNITIDTNLSNSVYDLSSSIEALYLDVSNLNMTKQPTINEGDLLISDTSGLELTLDGKQDTISFLSDICLNDLHVHGNIIIDGSLNFSFSEVIQNMTKEDDLSVRGDLIVNGGIYTDNFSVADTTGHTTIGGTLDVIGALQANGGITCDGPLQANSGTTSLIGNVGIGGSSGSETLLVSGSERVTSDLRVNGDLVVDGTFNFSEVIQNITTVNNEVVFSTQLDVSNQGTGPALKVSQFGVGDDQDVALFNAGLEGDALKIDSCGNSHFYKHVNVSGTMTSNTPWALLGQTIDGDSSDDKSGFSVSINAKGDIVAIGAPLDDNSGTDSGSTKMYQYIDGSWNQLGQTIDGDSSDDRSGFSVSINAKGDIVAIGAPFDDSSGDNNSGSTKMYQYTDGSWNQLGQTIYGDSEGSVESGFSVSINAKGDIVAIGAILDDNSGNDSGSTKIYQKGLRGNVTIEDDLSVGGDLIVNGGIYTDNFSVADTTGHTTIGGDIICNGKIDCNEIQVNSMPINSFTNLSLQYNYEIINNANYHWGKGRKLDISSNLPSCYSHIRQFTRFVPDTSSCITCVSPYFGTYLIEAHVIFRNNSSSRVNPVISIDIEEDTLGSENIPNWKSNFSNNYCQHNIFSVNNVGENAGRVSNLSASRIYRFTNTSDKVSIRTFIEKENGHEFKESVSNYEVFNAGISFKYIGNFPTPTFEE